MSSTNTIRPWKVSLLLFGSGLCALVYQMAWLREFRLIFGASTAASAAVLAIFMGGLGLGSLVLGHRADRKDRPLGYYASLEMAIAITAALTPLLLWLVGKVYVATGGSPVLGLWGATAVRLLLAALVLVAPTFLMGGTLPAAARAAEDERDAGRRSLALLYGANTLGAVTGSALATFLLVELFGTRKTLWAACLVNALIALIARRLSAGAQEKEEEKEAAEARADVVVDDAIEDAPAAPAGFVLAASAAVGFSFLLMELVWYRMLSPILGGSTYTFGMILAAALLGIGLGGAAYSLLRRDRPATLAGFALTCALEAVFVAVPFALGDRLALLAMLQRAMAATGFWGLVMGWAVVTLIVVLPAAFVSGVQFPLLIALLGRGRAAVGRHVGLAYAWNTAGAILGSLAGGFGLLPLLTAVNAWRLVAALLAALAAATLALAAMQTRVLARTGTDAEPDADTDEGADVSRRRGPHPLVPLAAPAVAAVAALALITATGPTAAWRHGSIGAGRSDRFNASPNLLRGFLHDTRRSVIREWEGVESSVALSNLDGYAFYVNGKADGHISRDAGTQIMGGLTGALVHPDVKTAMVIGLGTGSTAGWLGSIPGIERVDVVELEPAILEFARICALGNQNVMSNPKVHVTIGDAREALLTTPSRYDLIFSEPSNPYRAGIASLYTKEFYEACAERLNPGGLFLQWLQGYEVDGQTVRTVYATLGAVYPAVETWRTQSGDLLLMASLEPIQLDLGRMRARVAEEPFRSALVRAWRVTDLEGVLGQHIANSDFARAVVAAEKGEVNTDDHNVIEFSFARSVGRYSNFGPSNVLSLARARGELRPAVAGGEVDWEAVEDRRMSTFAAEGTDPPIGPQQRGEPEAPRHRRFRVAALAHMVRGNAAAAVEQWKRQPREPLDLTERMYMARAHIESAANEEAALPHIEAIRQHLPVEAEALMAHLRWRQRRHVEAVERLEATFGAFHSDPWAHADLMSRTLSLAIEVSRADVSGNAGHRLTKVMRESFALGMQEDMRMKTLVEVAAAVEARTGQRGMTAEAINRFEPNIPWNGPFLTARFNTYRDANHPLTLLAAKQLDEYRENEPFPFDFGLVPPMTQPATGPATGPTTGPTTGPILIPPELLPATGAPPTSAAPSGPSSGPPPGASESQRPGAPALTPTDPRRGGG